MRLPHAESAIIPVEKLKDYLLSPIHPIGRYKAAFFRSQGYRQEDAEILARDIKSLLDAEAVHLETTRFGTKYSVNATLVGPKKREFALNPDFA